MVSKIISFDETTGIGLAAQAIARRLGIKIETVSIFGWKDLRELSYGVPIEDEWERSRFQYWDERFAARLAPIEAVPYQLTWVDGLLCWGEDEETKTIFKKIRGRLRSLNPDLGACAQVIDSVDILAILGNPNVREYTSVASLLCQIPETCWYSARRR
jgi:hypothetical protein